MVLRLPLYDEAFYDSVNDAGASSADVVLPLALDLVGAESAIDVGCGTGIWAEALVRLGVADVVGIDGDYVPRHQLRLDSSRFRTVDLAAPLALERTFDLAVCLEVAEHLPPSRADGFVGDLVRLAPAILFSAAVPKQGGTHHVNEQWMEYWVSRFEQCDYICWDVVRPRIRYDRRVAWIYRQNIMLALGPAHPALSRLDPACRLGLPRRGDVAFDYVARYINERQDGLAATETRPFGRPSARAADGGRAAVPARRGLVEALALIELLRLDPVDRRAFRRAVARAAVAARLKGASSEPTGESERHSTSPCRRAAHVMRKGAAKRVEREVARAWTR